MCAKLLQSCPTLCDPMGCSPPGSSVHEILQARTLEWIAMPSSRGSSRPRDKLTSLKSLALAISRLVLYQYPPHNVIVRVNSTTYVQHLSQSNIQQMLIVISWCRQRKITETSKRNWQGQVARFCSLRMKSSWTLCVSRGVFIKQVFLHKYPSYPRNQEETTPNQ